MTFPKRSHEQRSPVRHLMRFWISALTWIWRSRDFLRTQSTDEASRLIILGLNHEQQHQELALTDIKHAFFSNPMRPFYEEVTLPEEPVRPLSNVRWLSFEGGLTEIGYSSNAEDPLDFCFDNETPRHRVYLDPFQIASREVTCREYLEFMLDDGYVRSSLWLSDGWEK